ncbi:MAG TPA: Crp/Fnr family transcriptional regulator [Candidatus Angelobacter sp.]|nr:Crp/Fnr family transcriptional regulator [Candidatus Angelobacter sp.]
MNYLVRSVRRGNPVYLSTDQANSVYYLQQGAVKLIRTSKAGDEVIIDRYYAGSMFGSLCFCDGPVCHEGIEREMAVALEDSQVTITTFESLKKDLHRCPEKLFSLVEDFCRRLGDARERISGLVLHEAEERLARTLVLMTSRQNGLTGSVTLNPPVTHEELARWIGVTRPFVTKLMQQLRERGFIESFSDGQIIVHRDKIASEYF